METLNDKIAITNQTSFYDGRRIVDVSFFFKELQKLSNHNNLKCSLYDIKIISEQREGLISGFKLQCMICSFATTVWTDDSANTEAISINTAAVAGILEIGGEFSSLSKLTSLMNIPSLSYQVYCKEHEKITKDMQSATVRSNKVSEKEEKISAEKEFTQLHKIDFTNKNVADERKKVAIEKKSPLLKIVPENKDKVSKEEKRIVINKRPIIKPETVFVNKKKTSDGGKKVAIGKELSQGNEIVLANKETTNKTSIATFGKESISREFPMMPFLKDQSRAKLSFKEISNAMLHFCDTFGLAQEDINKRIDVCNRIHEAFLPYFPKSQLIIYGSTLNKCGTKDSDLDMSFLPSPDYIVNYNHKVKKKKKRSVNNNFPSLKIVDDGIFPVENLINLDPSSILEFILPLIHRARLTRRAKYIPARCPILTFKCREMTLNCDIACGNRGVIHNTELLRFYLSLDSRVRPLVMNLRHWAKSVTIIKKGTMSSYAFTLLVIFFLQKTEPPVLPSVNHLSELADFSYIVDSWNVAFTTDKKKIQNSKNSKSSGELLRDFFLFYLEFDFSNNVICPNSGKCMSIRQFRQNYEKDSRMKDFKVKAISIQDPFILSRNVSGMNKLSTRSFKNSLFWALKNLTEIPQNTCASKFLSLLSKEENKISILLNFDEETLLSVKFKINSKQLTSYIICNALLELLKHGLLFDCEVIKQDAMAYNEFSNIAEVQPYLMHVMSVHCKIFNRTYSGRKKIEKTKETIQANCEALDSGNRFLRKEFILSNYMLQKKPSLRCSDSFFEFGCDCYKYLNCKFQKMQIIFRPYTERKGTKMIFPFLFNYLSTNIYKYLSDVEDFRASTSIDTK